ncbi:hypothetical protein [Vibrio mediterranei]|uniref:hypothetical protein n=1 Tax=Vibrio mediterranei TaxID=689 RepID=UPI0007867196|nr:hypothetical protein [Vibrio mediterranei]MCG9656441.1 hypothetical protein [Vibrio mediterranei]MCG9664585.1 hypothetical protein [Vibrio mediterranei]PTC06175.1 hypothetical protein C9980_05390 [Vibrio mediterranei]
MTMFSRCFTVTLALFLSVVMLMVSFVAIGNESNEAFSHSLSTLDSHTNSVVSNNTLSNKVEMASPHQCCASFCLLKVPCGQSLVVLNSGTTSLALMSIDDIGKAVGRVQILFRPPIA